MILLVEAASGIFGDDIELLRRRSQLIGRMRDALNGVPQTALHGLKRNQEACRLVIADNFYAAGQITAGNHLGDTYGLSQRLHDAAGQQRRQRDRGDERDHHCNDDTLEGVACHIEGMVAGCIGRLAIEIDEIGDRLGGAARVLVQLTPGQLDCLIHTILQRELDDLSLEALITGQRLVERGEQRLALRVLDQPIQILPLLRQGLAQTIEGIRSAAPLFKLADQQAQGAGADHQKLLIDLTEQLNGRQQPLVNFLGLILHGRDARQRENAEREDQQRHKAEAQSSPQGYFHLSEHNDDLT